VTDFDVGPSLLFCPADRPDRYAKAAARADAVILDLEDAVLPADRAAARRALAEHPLDPATTIVRLNPAGTDDFDADLAAIRATDYRTVMLAKTESAADVAAVGNGLRVIALCETARGVLSAGDIAFPAPLFHGDTLYTDTEIVDKRPSSSRQGQGIVTMRHTGRNQHGDVVATATRVALMWFAPDSTAPRAASRAGEGS
jgi:citrate lyase subunit beta/citryl-CoA lyase